MKGILSYLIASLLVGSFLFLLMHLVFDWKQQDALILAVSALAGGLAGAFLDRSRKERNKRGVGNQ